MINGYGVQKKDDNKYYDYSSSVFPFGLNPDELVLFNEEDVKELYYLGYQEPKSIEYRRKMTEVIKDIKNGVSPEEAAKKMDELMGGN